jgi:23S rRNA (pseudouridine1915-N3)-methyltransferase
VKIRLIAVSRADEDFIKEGVDYYVSRIKRYNDFDITILKASNSQDGLVNSKQEAKQISQRISKVDTLIALDENGKQFSSDSFSQFILKQQEQATKSLVFVIGGSYGLDETVLEAAQYKMSLSSMTLPHQLARLIFVEQLYRAFTIIKGEKYHHG